MRLQVVELANPLWLQTLEKLRHDIYHLPGYVALESRRTKATPEAILIIDNEKVFFLPYLLRQCNDIFAGELTTQKFFDVVSPYGYPGILLSEAAASSPEFVNFAMNQLSQVFHAKQVCSAFLRLHPILNQNLNTICKPDIFKVTGETVSIDLKLDYAEIWHQTRPEHRNKINRSKRTGLRVRMVPFRQYIYTFVYIYEETMERVGAAKFYYFGYDYFLKLANALGDNIHLCIVELEEQAICVGLFTECCRIVQYQFGGTKTHFLKLAPSKLMFDYVRFWAKERGNDCFHLGGGLGGSKDSLYHFKAGFSKQRYTFLTLRLIINEEQYLHLLKLRAEHLGVEVENLVETDFFPAYRSPELG